MSKKFIALMALFLSMGFFAPLAMAFSKDSLTWTKCTGCHEPEEWQPAAVAPVVWPRNHKRQNHVSMD